MARRPVLTRRMRLGAVLGLGLVVANAGAIATPALAGRVPERPPAACGPGLKAFVMSNGRTRCTHGPDPATVAAPASQAMPASSTEIAAGPTVPCIGDGVSGRRVQVLYGYVTGRPNRLAQFLPSIRYWAAQADDIFEKSANKTGGSRHVRWVMDSSCDISVLTVALPGNTSGDGDTAFDNTRVALDSQGYVGQDRKYLLFMDDDTICGQGEIWPDSDPSVDTNLNNGRDAARDGMTARVDSGYGGGGYDCWADDGHTVAHELMHTLGGVQPDSPHHSVFYHCTDEYDVMCYDDDDGTGPNPDNPPFTYTCPYSQEWRFDCNNDDYYHVAPPAGSYLATHWNSAKNQFLNSPGSTSGHWYGPQNLGGGVFGADVASWGTGRLDVFVRGTSGEVFSKSLISSSRWTGWSSIGAPPGLTAASDPTAVSWGLNRVDVFVRGSDGNLWTRPYGGSWEPWAMRGGPIDTAPDVASWGSGRLDVFAVRNGSLVSVSYVPGTGWTQTYNDHGQPSDGPLTSAPGVVSWGPNRIDVVARGQGNTLRHKVYDATLGGWQTGWTTVLGATGMTSAPDAASAGPGRVDVLYAGLGGDLKQITLVNGAWTAAFSRGVTISGDPGAVSWRGTGAALRLDVFYKRTDSGLGRVWYT